MLRKHDGFSWHCNGPLLGQEGSCPVNTATMTPKTTYERDGIFSGEMLGSLPPSPSCHPFHYLKALPGVLECIPGISKVHYDFFLSLKILFSSTWLNRISEFSLCQKDPFPRAVSKGATADQADGGQACDICLSVETRTFLPPNHQEDRSSLRHDSFQETKMAV